jgi:hypothetical protein
MEILKSLGAASLLASWLAVSVQPTSSAALTEVEAKAAFLYNLALFVEWPPASFRDPSALTICSTRSNPVVVALRSVDGRLVNGRTARVRELAATDDPRACQILYVAELDRESQLVVGPLAGSPVLTVGDDERFMRAGGMIRIAFENARLKFDVDVGRTDRGGLKISSKVLKLARVLRDGHVVRD